MKRRIRQALVACCVGLSGTSIGATGAAREAAAADAETVEVTQTETAGTEQATEAARTGEAEAEQAAEEMQAEATEPEEAGEAAQVEAAEPEEAGEAAQAEAAQPEEAGEAAQGEATEPEEAGEAAQVDAAQPEEAGEAAQVEAAEPEEAGEAAEPDDGAEGGIFSRIFGWFRDTDEDDAPEPAREREDETSRISRGPPLLGRQSSTTSRAPDGETSDITPSHVYQATTDLIAEIEVLRKAMNIAGEPRKAELQEQRTPLHAYTKSLEVMGKTARVQRRLGMIPVEVGEIPVQGIAPTDLLHNVQAIIEELRRVKRQLVIEDEIQPAPFAGGKTPSLVYKNLGDASYLLDGLVGRPTTSNDVYMYVLRVHDEMASIAAGLGVVLESDPPLVEGGRESKDVAQQILRAAYKIINLQTRLGMDASGVPSMPLGEVTPAEVFDTTNLLLAELVRVKVHLGIRSPPPERRESRGKQAADVFAQVLLVIGNLDILTRAAGNADH